MPSISGFDFRGINKISKAEINKELKLGPLTGSSLK